MENRIQKLAQNMQDRHIKNFELIEDRIRDLAKTMQGNLRIEYNPYQDYWIAWTTVGNRWILIPVEQMPTLIDLVDALEKRWVNRSPENPFC